MNTLSRPRSSLREAWPFLTCLLILLSCLTDYRGVLFAQERGSTLAQSISALDKDLSTLRGMASVKDQLQLNELQRLAVSPAAKLSPADVANVKRIHEKLDVFARDAKNRTVTQRPAFQAVQQKLDAFILGFAAPKLDLRNPGDAQVTRPSLPSGLDMQSKDRKKDLNVKDSASQSPAAKAADAQRAIVAQMRRDTLKRIAKPNPVLPIVIQTIERGLKGVPAAQKTELDRAYDRAIASHPNAPKEWLTALVANWHSLPETTRRKLAPAELTALSPDKVVDRAMLTRIARGVPVRTTPRGDPQVTPAPVTPQQLERFVAQIQNEFHAANKPGTALHHGLLTVPSADKIRQIVEDMYTPYIDSMEPLLQNGYEEGATITISGGHFAPKKEDNSLVLTVDMNDDSQGVFKEFPPDIASTAGSSLQFQLPPEAKKGSYYLRVDVKAKDGKTYNSNTVPLQVRKPFPPPPTLDKIEPNAQYPGQNVLVTGSGFTKWHGVGAITKLLFVPMNNQPILPTGYVNNSGHLGGAGEGSPFKLGLGVVQSNTQVDATLPYPGLLPGNYKVAMYISWLGKQEIISNWVVMSLRPFNWKLTFDTL